MWQATAFLAPARHAHLGATARALSRGVARCQHAPVPRMFAHVARTAPTVAAPAQYRAATARACATYARTAARRCAVPRGSATNGASSARERGSSSAPPLGSWRATGLSRAVPPLPVRAALVGTAVGLATPVFPVIGFVRAVYYFVGNRALRIAVFGGALSLLSFAVWDLLPYVYQHAPLLAPCALVNACVAAATYVGLDLYKGGPRSLLAMGSWARFMPSKALAVALGGVTWPVAGVIIGLVTALVAPFLYPDVVLWHWGVELDAEDSTRLRFAYRRLVEFMAPINLFTGAVAGALLQQPLAPLLTGSYGTPWPQAAGVALVVLAAVAGYTFYSGDSIHTSVAAAAHGAGDLVGLASSGHHLKPLALDQLLSRDQLEALGSVLRLDWRSGLPASSQAPVPHSVGGPAPPAPAVRDAAAGKRGGGPRTPPLLRGAEAATRVVVDGGERARQGAALRQTLRARVPPSEGGHPLLKTAGQAELQALRQRFALVQLVTSEPTPASAPSSQELAARRQLHTDAVARLCYLTRGQAGTHSDSDGNSATGGTGAAGGGDIDSSSGSGEAAGGVRMPMPLASLQVAHEVGPIGAQLRASGAGEDEARSRDRLRSAGDIAAMAREALAGVALLRVQEEALQWPSAQPGEVERAQAALRARRELEEVGWTACGGTVDLLQLDRALRDMGAPVSFDEDYQAPVAAANQRRRQVAWAVGLGVGVAVLVGALRALAAPR